MCKNVISDNLKRRSQSNNSPQNFQHKLSTENEVISIVTRINSIMEDRTLEDEECDFR